MKKNILIVDDEETMLRSMSFALKRAGYEVETAKDGQDAFDKVLDAKDKNKLFDLIVTDVAMPNLNGLEFIDKLNKEKSLVPVIAITGHADRKIALQLILKGCDAYIIKPFDHEKLIRSINKVLAEQQNLGT